MVFKPESGWRMPRLHLEQPAEIGRIIISQVMCNFLGAQGGVDQQPFSLQDDPVLDHFIGLRQFEPFEFMGNGFGRHQQQLRIVCHGMFGFVFRIYQAS